jgi:hypothetical protein
VPSHGQSVRGQDKAALERDVAYGGAVERNSYADLKATLVENEVAAPPPSVGGPYATNRGSLMPQASHEPSYESHKVALIERDASHAVWQHGYPPPPPITQ